MCKVKKPETQIAVSSPAPAAPSAAVAQTDPENYDATNDKNAVKRKGRNALRIPLTMGGAGGGQGLNIPNG